MIECQLSQKTYQSTYVAYLDILGFKDIVLAHSHEHLKSLYLRTFLQITEHALSNDKRKSFLDGETLCIWPDIRQAVVNSSLFSDSIFIWTDNDSADSFVNIVTTVRNLLSFSIIHRLPLRGAISYGPLTAIANQLPSQTHNFQNSLFGKAVVYAFKAEKVQEWVGCMITPNAIKSYKDKCLGKAPLIKEKMIATYPVPVKGDKKVVRYVIDWVNHPHTEIDFTTVTNAFNPHKRPTPKAAKIIIRKLKNTLMFVKHVKPSADQPRRRVAV